MSEKVVREISLWKNMLAVFLFHFILFYFILESVYFNLVNNLQGVSDHVKK